MKIKNFYIVLFLFVFGIVFSQELPPPTEVVTDTLSIDDSQYGKKQIDSAFAAGYETDNAIFAKKFQENFQKKYNTPEFDYTATKPQVSLWDKFWKWVEQFFRDLFGQPDPQKAFSYTEAILKFLAIILIGFVLYLIINFIFNKNGNYFFSKKNKKLNIDHQDVVENIHEINFSETIARLEREKDFRSAVRYQFLQILKKYSDQKIIVWNPEKTNQDYAKEITNESLRTKFMELAYIYDYVWYGEFDINENDYEIFKKKFNI